MRRVSRGPLLVLLAVAVSLVGCDSKPTHESVMQESLGKMKELVQVLKGVTDENSAAAAKPKLQAINTEMKAIKAKADALGTPSDEQEKTLRTKHEAETEAVTKDLFEQTFRISTDPKLAPALEGALPDDGPIALPGATPALPK